MEFIDASVNRSEWLKFRNLLYHDLDMEFDQMEMDKISESDWLESFLIKLNNQFIGLIELSLRNMVDGCISSPVAYIEGIYLTESERGKGLGKSVIDWAKEWGRSKGCTEMASDVEISNSTSQAFHESIGFKETYRVVEYRMSL